MYEMKESGIKWIGQIPKHWEVRKVKYITRIYTGNSISDNDKSQYSDDYLSLPYISTKNIDLFTSIISYETDIYTKIEDKKFKVAYKNSILLCIEGGNAGKKVGYTNRDVSFVNKLCCFDTYQQSKFLFYYIKSPAFTYEFTRKISGLIGGVSIAILKNFSIPFPPLDEQKKIADFLDKKVSEIENLIYDTKKLIEKYRGYKQSIITETVTKGLNSNVEMKESGIEWIGQIPKHWKIKLVKELFYNVNNKNIGVKEKNLLSLSYGKIIPKDIYKNDGLVPANFNNYNIIKYDDIVLRLTDLQNDKKSLRVGHARENGIITSAYITLRPVSNYSTRYYYFLLHFYDICKYFYGVGSGVRQSLSFEEVKKILILFPPLNEQEEIAKYLDDKCSQIDNIIEEKQLLLEKLEAYKKSLIYEYVTGKKQVENE